MKVLVLSLLLAACGSTVVPVEESPSCVSNTGITTCDQQDFYVYSETQDPSGAKSGKLGQCKQLGCAQGMFCIVTRQDDQGMHFDQGHCR